jgi:hypothetical protein
MKNIVEHKGVELTAADVWKMWCDPTYLSTPYLEKTIGIYFGEPVNLIVNKLDFEIEMKPFVENAINILQGFVNKNG